MLWGLLGPEQLFGFRRTRTLDLGAAVRSFNQAAVPGLGGVWYAKQLVLATLGVIVAGRVRQKSGGVKTIEIANAIEALACWCAFESINWDTDSDPRLRGSRKLRGKTDLTFTNLRAPGFYVTQPMRMATVEALVALGFVKPGSNLFNSFRQTDAGQDLVDAATHEYRPYNGTVEDYLVKRILERDKTVDTPELRLALSPLMPLARDASNIIRTRLCEGAGLSRDAARRKNALDWVSSIRPDAPADWKGKPLSMDAGHWRDLRLGASFFQTRDAAIEVLDSIEALMAPLAAERMAVGAASNKPAVKSKLMALRRVAQKHLDQNGEEGSIAAAFCKSCVDQDPVKVIRGLVARDNRVLLLRGDDIAPGPAFSQNPETVVFDDAAEGPGEQNIRRVPVPQGISPRIQNLYLLDLDLRGKLKGFLRSPLDRNAT